MSDLRFALRRLLRQPVVSATAVVTIALAIGANTAILSIADAVLFRPLPYADTDRLFVLQMQNRRTGTRYFRVAATLYDALAQTRGVQQAARYASGAPLTVSTDDGVQPLRTLLVDANYFSTLGVTAALGRLFEPADAHAPAAARSIVLTHAAWRRHFAARAFVIGTQVSLGGASYDVMGVLPEAFLFPTSFPTADVVLLATSSLSDPQQGTLSPIVRLAPDRTREQAEAELAAIANGMLAVEDQLSTPVLASIRESLFPRGRPLLSLLLVAAISVLMIGCTNISTMLAVSAKQREHEIGISLALGVSRARLVRQPLLAGLLIGVSGAALAIAATRLSFGPLLDTVPSVAYGAARVGVDGRVAVISLAAGVLSAVLFSVVPMWHASRADAVALLRGAPDGGRMRRFGHPAIVIQVAAAVVLAFGAIIATKSLVRLLHVPFGFDSERVIAISGYPQGLDAKARREFFVRAIDQLRSLPEVVSAGAITGPPFSGTSIYESSFLRGQRLPAGGAMYVLPGYFETVGIRLVRGRLPAPEDLARDVAVVSESGARILLDPQRDPTLQSVERAGGRLVPVVGVVADVTHGLGQQQPVYTYLMPLDRTPPMTLMAKVRSANPEMPRRLRRAVGQLAPATPVSATWWARDINSTTTFRTPRFQTLVLGSFGALSLVLTIVGIHGVVSFVTARRNREIGVRLAIGSTPAAVARLFVAQMMAPIGFGLVAGALAVWWLNRISLSQWVSIQPNDPGAGASAVAVILVSALVAGYLPAHRASRLDPATILRHE